ncbi:hypothetical protein ACWD6I_14050 [Streptomyces sp. NPDC002454]
MNRRVRGASVVATLVAGVSVVLSSGTAQAQGSSDAPGSFSLININAPLINGPLISNTGDIDFLEDILEHISIPILGQSVHQMYEQAKFEGGLFGSNNKSSNNKNGSNESSNNESRSEGGEKQ